MPRQADEKKRKGGSKKKVKHGSVMLDLWLNEPSGVVSATDVWSSERAISRPRRDAENSDDSGQRNAGSRSAAETA
ncbi:hypothetical protein ACJ41O_001757 [Fusarium nematophilum]